MRRSTGLLLVFLAALGLLVSVGPLVGPAEACSCAASSQARAAEASDAAFVGTLASRSPGREVAGGATASSILAADDPNNPKGLNGPVLLLSFTTIAGAVGFLMIVRRHRRRMRAQQRRTPPRTRPSA